MRAPVPRILVLMMTLAFAARAVALQPANPDPARDDAQVLPLLERAGIANEPVADLGGPGTFAFDTIDETWRDQDRGRDVPVRIYRPRLDAGPRAPVLVFSHGAGGSRNGYAYLGKHLASRGWLVVVPQHAGSDTAALAKGGLRIGATVKDMIADERNLIDRPADITFVIDELARRESTRAVADVERLAVAGHSFGSYTALAVGGLTNDVGQRTNFSHRDPRVRAVIAMSPQGPGTMGITRRSWDGLAVPILALTGTEDYGSGGQAAAWREAMLAHVRTPLWLLTIDKANHMTFAVSPDERPRLGAKLMGARTNEQHTRAILRAVTAFLDAEILARPAARAWLATDAMAHQPGAEGVLKRANTP